MTTAISLLLVQTLPKQLSKANFIGGCLIYSVFPIPHALHSNNRTNNVSSLIVLRSFTGTGALIVTCIMCKVFFLLQVWVLGKKQNTADILFPKSHGQRRRGRREEIVQHTFWLAICRVPSSFRFGPPTTRNLRPLSFLAPC